MLSRKSLRLSQNAHSRLFKRARKAARANPKKKHIFRVKEEYHSLCSYRQEKLNRVLTRSEKKRAFSDAISMAKYN